MDKALETLLPQVNTEDSPDPQQDALLGNELLTDVLKEDHFTPTGAKVSSSAHLELPPRRATSRSLDHDRCGFGAVYTVAPSRQPTQGAKVSHQSAHTSVTAPDFGYYDPRC